MIKFTFLGKGKISNFKYALGSAKQIIDNFWQVEEKVKELATMITSAKYPIIFTGAGISTSIGIPDYRSGHNTVIKTGAGLWNRQQLKIQAQPHQLPIDKLVDLANPSLTHMCIATFIEKGIFKHLISQNTDGLHLRSGISIQNISELHGNRNLQFCTKCSQKYLRDFRTLKRDGKKFKPGEKRDHNTGRHCQNCEGDLHDSIIYFGQKLPKDQLMNAYKNASIADLCICVGSSLTVKPSSNIPLMTVNKQLPGKLCIVNIQQTPLDSIAELRINYFCDEVFDQLAQAMKVQIQKLTIRHYLKIKLIKNSRNVLMIQLVGKDKQGNNLSFINEAYLRTTDSHVKCQIQGHRYVAEINKQILQTKTDLQIIHYGDKSPFCLNINNLNLLENIQRTIVYQIQENKEWQLL